MSNAAHAIVAHNVKPHHQHDCKQCTFLGRTSNSEGAQIDLYTCEQGGMGRTYIQRFSSDEPDYGTLPDSVLRRLSPPDFLTEGMKIYELAFALSLTSRVMSPYTPHEWKCT